MAQCCLGNMHLQVAVNLLIVLFMHVTLSMQNVSIVMTTHLESARPYFEKIALMNYGLKRWKKNSAQMVSPLQSPAETLLTI